MRQFILMRPASVSQDKEFKWFIAIRLITTMLHVQHLHP